MLKRSDMKSWIVSLSLALAACAALAQSADGEVTKIDKAQSRLTLRHTGVKGLDMPAMTMIFRVGDAKMLDAVAVGDKVKFDAQKADGFYTVTRLVKAP